MIHDSFTKNQTITADWHTCHLRFDDIHASLRPSYLKPKIDIFDFNIPFLEKQKEIEENNVLKSSKINQESILFVDGNVLAFYPYRCLGDGLISSASNGFFSEDDTPPWSSWFYISHDDLNDIIVYCWIPSRLIPLINNALENDFYQSYKWLNLY